MSTKSPLAFSRQNILQFFYYNLGGVVFFASGYLVFILLYGALHWHWLIAKAIADLAGWALNYLVQHYLAFKHNAREQGHRKVLKKYVPFSLFNILLDYAIVGGLKWVGVSPFVGLWIAAIFFTFWKWFWYKYWVFEHRQLGS
ncbi:GtrA family protein [Candidatus Saccharibacteria bacterium]|nr:GtrA family protein [Candidatus Saccharibacteria bacterium]